MGKRLDFCAEMWYTIIKNGMGTREQRTGKGEERAMCGRYTTDIETDEAELFRMLARAEMNIPLASAAQKTPRVLGREVFPSEYAAVLAQNGTGGGVDAFLYRWGYPAEINGKKRLLINARSETAAEKALYAESLVSRRCVVLTAGFFEWMHNGKKADPKLKYRFNMTKTGILYLAGLYRISPTTGEYEFVILTRDANESMAPIHDRMPVILRPEHVDEYLGDTNSAAKLLCETPPILIKKLVS